MPRVRASSGALSIWSYAVYVAPPVFARIFVIAAVKRRLAVDRRARSSPMLQCGLFRSNFAFVMVLIPNQSVPGSIGGLLARQLGNNFVRHGLRYGPRNGRRSWC